MSKCPHTMRVKDIIGAVHCGDCGKLLKDTKRMNRLAIILPAALALAGCSLTPAEQAAVTTASVTLASVAAAHNTTAADLLAKGALACGDVVSPEGVLIGSVVKIVLTSAGVPASVTNAGPDIVAAACHAIGLVPGAVAAATDPATVQAVVVPTALPGAV